MSSILDSRKRQRADVLGFPRIGAVGPDPFSITCDPIQTSRSGQPCVSAGSQSWKARVRSLPNAAWKLT